MIQLRDIVFQLLPNFLRGDIGQRVMYTLGLAQDVSLERFIAGVQARFPYYAPFDALNAIGRDRGIIRGFAESHKAYRQRLLQWRDVWRGAGTAKTLMDQIAGYFDPHEVTVKIVTNSGVWYERDTDGVFSYEVVSPNNWDWDGDTASWSRFWLFIYPPTDGSLWDIDDTWADGTWGDTGECFGLSATIEQADACRLIVSQFKPAGSRCEWIVPVVLGGADPDPYGPGKAVGSMADGEWGTWHDKTTSSPAAPSRNALSRWWQGIPDGPTATAGAGFDAGFSLGFERSA